MTVMAILQDADKCMRCNGCVTACKREWNLKLPTSMAEVIPQKSIVNPRQRLAIKSLKRGDMGPFMRFSCWHCPDPPCAAECPFGAIKKLATGAINVDNVEVQPEPVQDRPGPQALRVRLPAWWLSQGRCGLRERPLRGSAQDEQVHDVHRSRWCRYGPDAVDPNTALPTRAPRSAGPIRTRCSRAIFRCRVAARSRTRPSLNSLTSRHAFPRARPRR